jgi:hypothetical protein
MWWNDVYKRGLQLRRGRRAARHKATGHGLRLRVEQLEDRMMPFTYTAGTVSDLIADINAANAAGGSNTITLVAGTTFTLTEVNNTTIGATGLPVIAANDDLTIIGNGDVIQRSTAMGTPTFRLLEVAEGASLTLQSLTLQGGAQVDWGLGGGILNYGALSLSGVTIQNNVAGGSWTAAALGGGIYSDGSLTMQGCTIRNNQAIGANSSGGAPGHDAEGGGVYIRGGTASLNSVTLSANTAQGGNGAKGESFGGGGSGSGAGHGGHVGATNGGNGLGGGMYVAGGTVNLLNTSMSNDAATGGKKGGGGASAGLGEGGGLYIDVLASVSLDAFTVANIINNIASTTYPNIYGSYSTL